MAACGFLAESAFAGGDPAKGEALFKRSCQACHTVQGTQNRVGPYLAGLSGRPIASAEKYRYTPAMLDFAATHDVWTAELLAEYLQNPRAMVPKTRMAFAGIRDAADAQDLAAYLESLPPAK
ncbi:c-type cytochrome [Martelella alba]|uniref:C-type cytochrome n=2 Tax=Martelella alba TaxID=2590451 RepID=A0A506UFP7_9HYPH|nr:c-type cytochrome [Martelella alba]